MIPDLEGIIDTYKKDGKKTYGKLDLKQNTGEFAKRVRVMSSQLFVCRGLD